MKPEIVSDVKLAKVSLPARYTFVLLITQADDVGLVAAAHRQLLGTLYPLDEAVTVAVLLDWVEELVTVGLVRWRATRDGVPVLQIVNWSRHQRVDNAGRSQLGALLAESPADRATQPADSRIPTADVRGESPRLAEARGDPPLGPPTTDLGSPTKDQGSPTTDRLVQAAIALTMRANQGLRDHTTRPQADEPLIATAGHAAEAVAILAGADVPLEFAERAMYELAKSHTSKKPVRSIKYFADAIVRAWEEHQAAGAAAANGRPGPITLNGSGRGRYDGASFLDYKPKANDG